MVSRCSVNVCDIVSYKESGVSFHKFPSNLYYKKKWMKLIPGNHGKRSVVCSRHFKPDDYTNTAVERRRLKSNAVPSLCLKKLSGTKVKQVLYALSLPSDRVLQYRATIEQQLLESKKKQPCISNTQKHIMYTKPILIRSTPMEKKLCGQILKNLSTNYGKLGKIRKNKN